MHLPQVLHTPVYILAEVFVPDFKVDPCIGRRYALIQVGKDIYLFIYKNPDLGTEQDVYLGSLPGELAPWSIFPHVTGGHEGAQGVLAFHERDQALSWFRQYFTQQGPGEMLAEADCNTQGKTGARYHTQLPDGAQRIITTEDGFWQVVGEMARWYRDRYALGDEGDDIQRIADAIAGSITPTTHADVLTLVSLVPGVWHTSYPLAILEDSEDPTPARVFQVTLQRSIKNYLLPEERVG